MVSTAEMDALIDEHIAAEMAGDVQATVAMYADGIDHDVVGWPTGPVHGLAAVQDFYGQLNALFENHGMERVRSRYGEDFCVVEHRSIGVFRHGFAGAPGSDDPVTFRMLHVWEFRDGRISSENVWLDSGAIVGQLLAAQ